MRLRGIALLGALLLAGSTWAQQDPLADATAAYRKGEFRKAVKLFASAADAESDSAKRADIRVKLAWTYFAMKNKTKAEEALVAALKDSPQLELVADYYTDEFMTLFARAKVKASAPPSQPTPAAPRATAAVPTISQLRVRLAQAADNIAVEAILSELQSIEAGASAGALPDILEVKAEALERLGKTSEGLELRGKVAALRAAAQALPGTSPVPLEALLEARRLVATNRPDDAVSLLHGVLSAQPSCIPALEVLADALLEAGKLDDAFSALKTALLGNEKPELLLSLGEVETRRGHLPGARDAFRRVVEIDPGNDRAWAALGLLGARMGDVPAAREALDKALAANGTLFEARVVRAEIALIDHQPAAALQHLERALQIRPDDPWALGWQGVAFLAADNARAALEKLRPAAAASPRFALPLAEALRRSGKVNEALAVLSASKSSGSEATTLRARCLLDAGRPADAESALKELLAADPDDARAHCLLASAYHAQRRWTEAEQELKRASDLPGAPADVKDAQARVDATRLAQELLDQALTPPKPAPPR